MRAVRGRRAACVALVALVAVFLPSEQVEAREVAPAAASSPSSAPVAVLRQGGHPYESGTAAVVYGRWGDLHMLCDWDGDGTETFGLYRPSDATWYVRFAPGGGTANRTFRYGTPGVGDQPLCGDWNGDGIATPGIYRGATAEWHLTDRIGGGAANRVFRYGRPGAGDLPLVGDWNNDGIDTVGLFRTSDNLWYLRNANNGGAAHLSFIYGRPGLGDTPLVGDWDGNGTDTPGIYRPSEGGRWHLRNANSGGPASWVTAFGANDDTPLAGDWDGDGADEPVQISAMEVDTVLSQLVARAEGPRTGYDRDLFNHWITTNGCDTRERVLWAEAITTPSVSSSCSLTGGTWRSPYDGLQSTDSSAFHVDHMVPLAEAWDSGANGWTAARRQAFANDVTYPGALVVASASSNTSKSDQDPAEWQPTNTAYTCTYASDWLRTKLRWLLGADTAEWTALQQMLHSCPNGRLTSSINLRSPSPALPVPPPPPPPPPGCSTKGNAYIPANGGCIDRYDADHNGDINCTELPAAAKPVTVKNPGNDPYGLDGDSDGVGCE